jgi:hypothetical protein
MRGSHTRLNGPLRVARSPLLELFTALGQHWRHAGRDPLLTTYIS